jgi:hypothetical protein
VIERIVITIMMVAFMYIGINTLEAVYQLIIKLNKRRKRKWLINPLITQRQRENV